MSRSKTHATERPSSITDWLELWRSGRVYISPLDDANELERLIDRAPDILAMSDSIITGIIAVVTAPWVYDALRWQAMSLVEHVALRSPLTIQDIRALTDASAACGTHWPTTALTRLLGNPKAKYDRVVARGYLEDKAAQEHRQNTAFARLNPHMKDAMLRYSRFDELAQAVPIPPAANPL